MTSLTATEQADAFLVSSLDSTIRLIDKADGRLLQSFKETKFTNEAYRLRSTLAAKDALVLSGGEDGSIFAWDVLSGQCVQRFCHDATEVRATGSNNTSKKAVSSVACKRGSTEWASAGGDGEFADCAMILPARQAYKAETDKSDRHHRHLGRHLVSLGPSDSTET